VKHPSHSLTAVNVDVAHTLCMAHHGYASVLLEEGREGKEREIEREGEDEGGNGQIDTRIGRRTYAECRHIEFKM
jgi:hypothetical protein